MRISHKTLLVFLILSTNVTNAQDAEFIWAEDDRNGSQIYISQHKNGAWQPAEKIVDDSKLNILPTIGSDTKGRKLVVWCMVDEAQSVLKYSIKRGNAWQQPKTLSSQMATNLAPVVVFDNNDIGWVFWSANNGDDDDDIYVSRFVRGQWSNPEMVNVDNNTPDILPEAGLDENGNIWVSWQQLQGDAYKDMTKSFELSSHSKMATTSALTTQNIKILKLRSNLNDSISPPAFFKGRSRATMHFPQKNRSSKPIKGNLN